MAQTAVNNDARDTALAVIATNPGHSALAAPAQVQQRAPDAIPTDPDDLALYLAQQEDARDGGRQADGIPRASAPQQQAQQPAKQAPKGIVVPKARLDEVLKREQALQNEVINLQAALLRQPAQTNPGQTQQAPAPQAQSLDQQILSHQAYTAAAAARFDQGEISMVDFVNIQNNATNAIQSLRERALYDAVQRERPAQMPGLADQQILDQQTALLEQQSPYLAIMTKGDLDFLVSTFRAEQAALARPIGTGPAETLRLRHGVAELALFWGPRLYPTYVPAQRPAQAGTQTNQATVQQNQAQVKLRTAAAHPPQINQQSAAGPHDEVSDARIETMSTEEILALPPAMRERIMNR